MPYLRLTLVFLACFALCTPASAQSTQPTSKPKSQPKSGDAPVKPKTGEGTAATPVAEGAVYVKIATSIGDMVVELNAKKAPKTVENFLHYVDTKYFDGTIFHRVISNFMVQGGGFVADGIESPMARPKKTTRPPVVNEADNGLKNEYGTIAMARTQAPNSATSQFFINVKSNLSLNHKSKTPRGWGYCVFGRVVDGFDTLEKIRNAKTKPLPIMGNRKVLPDPIITITSVRRTEKPAKKK